MEKLEITETNTVYKYKAIDGTIFPTEHLCRQYENTVACVLRSRLQIKECDAWDFCHGYEDNIVEIVSGKKDDVLNYAVYCKPGNMNVDEITKSYKKCPLLIFRNSDGAVYSIIWLNDFTDNINNCCKDETC